MKKILFTLLIISQNTLCDDIYPGKACDGKNWRDNCYVSYPCFRDDQCNGLSKCTNGRCDYKGECNWDFDHTKLYCN